MHTDSSKFTSSLFDLVEAAYYVEDDALNEKIKNESNKFKLTKLNKELEKFHKSNIDRSYARSISLVDSLTTSFDDLWDFASFIYSIEKVYFYKNDADSLICARMSGKSASKRELVFLYPDKNIRIKAEMEIGKDKILNAHIYHEYGAKMHTNMEFINGMNTYTEDDDLMVINTINEYLKISMKSILMEYYNKAANRKIYNEKRFLPDDYDE